MKISANKLISIIQEAIRKTFLSLNEYHLDSLDELMEYMWLKPKDTGLNVDIFVDDGGSYRLHHHKLILFARNGYNKTDEDFIPISIERNPQIMKRKSLIKLLPKDLSEVRTFIKQNLLNLYNLADRQISQIEFSLKIDKINRTTNEARGFLTEMATLRKEDSGLPMDVWIDEGMTYIRHAPRMKFKASNEQRTTREFSSILITNPPVIENLPEKSNLEKRDIEKLKTFVEDNMELLLKVANGEIDFRRDFLPNMKKVF